jgi:phage N-6-adenine-methyltransferase
MEILNIEERNELERCEIVIKQGLETFVEVGTALMTIRNKKLYRFSFLTFEDYCRNRWGMARNYANKMISASEVISNISPLGTIVPTTESQARPLTQLEPEVQREAWSEVIETHGDNITAAKVDEVVQNWKGVNEEVKTAKANPLLSIPAEEIIEQAKATRPMVRLFTGENEWYTPQQYIESARLVMGSIDVDPASNAEAQKAVQALRYYTIEDDGLIQEWTGNIWMNPPYSGAEIKKFIGKLVEEFQLGNLKQAVVLTNNSSDTSWFHSLAEISSLICFTKGRINFYRGDQLSSPTNGQSFFYVGKNAGAFAKEFTQYGLIMQGYDKK